MCCSAMTDRKYKGVGWGLLVMLWGFTILFEFIPFWIGLVGTGLILLGVNAIRRLNAQSTSGDNLILGILALTWGMLELARPLLLQVSASGDWDWGIFAILLVTLGVILLVRASKLPAKDGID